MTNTKITITEDIPTTLAEEVVAFSKSVEEFTFLATGGHQATACYPTLRGYFESQASHGQIVIGDERLVPLASTWSNTAMLFDLFDEAKGALSLSSPVLPLEGELAKIEEIMGDESVNLQDKTSTILDSYSALLRQVVANYDRIISKSPKTMFVHLGLGPDGHIASLFPNRSDLGISGKYSQISVDLDQNNKMLRTSVTFDTLNSAEVVVVSASGSLKGELIARALNNDYSIPLAHLSPKQLIFVVDQEAGDAISGS
ncbi:MAG: 6-phosphogluconolactonase [Actinomycetota bacterium]|nr:6-phosphogluconolactonase [Actinomycetota bacterium]